MVVALAFARRARLRAASARERTAVAEGEPPRARVGARGTLKVARGGPPKAVRGGPLKATRASPLVQNPLARARAGV